MTSIKNIRSHILRCILYNKMFGKFGKGSILRKPLELKNTVNISVGEKTFIGEQAWLMVVNPKGKGIITLGIGDNVQIGHFVHIIAMKSVKIHDFVLIADKVFISDCTHSFNDISSPVFNQPLLHLKNVVIGESTWIGENVSILGVSIGKHCVIGANSVVTKDIPDYSVAVGVPAKVIKKYDSVSALWVPVREKRLP